MGLELNRQFAKTWGLSAACAELVNYSARAKVLSATEQVLAHKDLQPYDKYSVKLWPFLGRCLLLGPDPGKVILKMAEAELEKKGTVFFVFGKTVKYTPKKEFLLRLIAAAKEDWANPPPRLLVWADENGKRVRLSESLFEFTDKRLSEKLRGNVPQLDLDFTLGHFLRSSVDTIKESIITTLLDYGANPRVDFEAFLYVLRNNKNRNGVCKKILSLPDKSPKDFPHWTPLERTSILEAVVRGGDYRLISHAISSLFTITERCEAIKVLTPFLHDLVLPESGNPRFKGIANEFGQLLLKFGAVFDKPIVYKGKKYEDLFSAVAASESTSGFLRWMCYATKKTLDFAIALCARTKGDPSKKKLHSELCKLELKEKHIVHKDDPFKPDGEAVQKNVRAALPFFVTRSAPNDRLKLKFESLNTKPRKQKELMCAHPFFADKISKFATVTDLTSAKHYKDPHTGKVMCEPDISFDMKSNPHNWHVLKRDGLGFDRPAREGDFGFAENKIYATEQDVKTLVGELLRLGVLERGNMEDKGIVLVACLGQMPTESQIEFLKFYGINVYVEKDLPVIMADMMKQARKEEADQKKRWMQKGKETERSEQTGPSGVGEKRKRD